MLRVDVLHNSNDFESHELQQLRARVLSYDVACVGMQ